MLVVMGANRNNQLVDEMARTAHDIDVTEGYGIEASGIKADAQCLALRKRDGTPSARAIF